MRSNSSFLLPQASARQDLAAAAATAAALTSQSRAATASSLAKLGTMPPLSRSTAPCPDNKGAPRGVSWLLAKNLVYTLSTYASADAPCH